ncbi:hypothetical protein Tco_0163775 [Tanacetum coccineum]
MIDIYNVSHKDYLEDLFANEKITNHQSGNPTFSCHIDLTSPEVINPLSGSTTSSSPSLPIFETSDYSLEEFTDELTHFTFPPRIDYLPFDAESDLREIECSHACTCALLYSSPPLWDNYDDELFDLESVNDNTYDDPFDFKEKKIKDAKLLIDELDPPRSSIFLPSPKFDSVFYEDFSEVDALPSTNNEDKVFNLGILIHESHFEVTNRATPEKNVKKITISNNSLILEDFNPPLYELPFQKEVLESETLLSFSSENEEKVFSLLKEFIPLFSWNYLIGTLKFSKSLIFLKSRWRFFRALIERTSVFWMLCVSISIPLNQF